MEASNARALSSNVDKSYGICMAMNNVFYTQPVSPSSQCGRNLTLFFTYGYDGALWCPFSRIKRLQKGEQ
eukprot:1738176-Amphidinium_carterae.1